MSKIRTDTTMHGLVRRRMLSVVVVLLTPALALLPAACGGELDPESSDATIVGPSGRESGSLTVVLDFVPNAVHTGIYCALGTGYYAEDGLEVEIVEPSSTADTLRLIEAGEADVGIADAIDVADQIDRGRAAKGVMAVTQRPLGGLIALESSDIEDPADLDGRRVGTTGIPSDSVVLETMVSSAGGDPEKVETVTIGFNGVQALLNGRVDAFTGFTVADGAQVESTGAAVSEFELDAFGGPSYPGLVMFSTEARIAEDRVAIDAFVDATVRGYEETLSDPDRCLEELLSMNPELEPDLQRAQLQGYLPLLQADAPAYGEFRAAKVESLVRFLTDAGLISEPIEPDRFATNEFVESR